MTKKKESTNPAVILVVFAVHLINPFSVGAGNLEPSSPPGATMKTLDEVEARMPIKPADMPKTIRNSGSYYVTGNYTGREERSAIIVAADHVTIDVNGYVLDGGGVGTDGILIEADVKGTTIRNGSIKNWSGMGVNSEEAERTYVKNIGVDSAGTEAFFLASGAIAIGCSATGCQTGFVFGADGIAKRCIARNNTSSGFVTESSCIVSECVASGNGTNGLEEMKTLAEVEPRTPIPASSSPAGVFNIYKSGSYYLQGNRSCSGTGIYINTSDVTIDLMGYRLTGSGGQSTYGIHMNRCSNVRICNGTVRSFGQGVYGLRPTSACEVIGVYAKGNAGNGISLEGDYNVVKDCTVVDNGAEADGYVYGIYSNIGCTISGNTVANNGWRAGEWAYGIYVGPCSLVTGNRVYKNGYEGNQFVFGIYADSGSTVRQNACSENGYSAGGEVFGLRTHFGCSVVGNSVYNNGVASEKSYGIYLNEGCLADQNSSYDNNTTSGGSNLYGFAYCVYGNNVGP